MTDKKHYPYTRDKDGWYIDKDECHTETLEDFLQSSCLGFCCCGSPEENLKYIQKGLKMIELRITDDYDTFWKDSDRHFGNRVASNFFFYWADKEELTEHGGLIPGWLTDKGKELLGLLEELENTS